MLVVSNNLVGKMPIPKRAILRVNLAWIKNLADAKRVLNNSQHDIYLDYPQGRTKPPKPTIGFDDAIRLTNHPRVKYFAVSNIEDIEDVKSIIESLGDVEFIPKIETSLGVKNINKMVKVGVRTIMLDKEDLYTSVNCNCQRFNKLVEEARNSNAEVLELKGVIFQ